jgi:hypothetical protein
MGECLIWKCIVNNGASVDLSVVLCALLDSGTHKGHMCPTANEGVEVQRQ